MSQAIDSRLFRTTLGQFCTGVVIVTGRLHGEPFGFAAQSFTSLSLDPPLVAVCPARSSTSWPKIQKSNHFCINILGRAQKSICDVFAESGGEKFKQLKWKPAQRTGSPLLDGVIGYIDCELTHEHEAGDHTIAVGKVLDLNTIDAHQPPLLFFRGMYGSFAVGLDPIR